MKKAISVAAPPKLPGQMDFKIKEDLPLEVDGVWRVAIAAVLFLVMTLALWTPRGKTKTI